MDSQSPLKAPPNSATVAELLESGPTHSAERSAPASQLETLLLSPSETAEAIPGEEKATPLPKGKIFTISIIMFLNQFSAYMVYPFLPFFMSTFFPKAPIESLGYYISWFGASFYLGTMCGSILWGFLSDYIGRKKTLLISISCLTVILIVFPFANTYYLALIFRFIWGIFDEITGVAKTVLSETCDDSNQARGFSITGMAFGLAAVLGPSVGGLLAEPKKNFSWLYKAWGLLRKYPYLLPFLVTALLSLITLSSVFFSITETLKASKRRKLNLKERFSVLKDPIVLFSISCYACLSMVLNIIITVIPLWFVNPHWSGGFELTSTEIGILVSSAGPLQVVFQRALWLYPWLISRFGYRKMMILLCMYLAGVLVLAPCASLMNEAPRGAVYAILIISISIVMLLLMFSFTERTNTFILVNNSVESARKGLVNGTSHAVMSILNIFAPIISGNVYAWSTIHDRSWPLNHHLIFYIMIVFLFVVVYSAYQLPATIDQKKPDERDSLTRSSLSILSRST